MRIVGFAIGLVLASALAVFVAIYFSISTNFYIGAVCYLALLPLLLQMAAAKVE